MNRHAIPNRCYFNQRHISLYILIGKKSKRYTSSSINNTLMCQLLLKSCTVNKIVFFLIYIHNKLLYIFTMGPINTINMNQGD